MADPRIDTYGLAEQGLEGVEIEAWVSCQDPRVPDHGGNQCGAGSHALGRAELARFVVDAVADRLEIRGDQWKDSALAAEARVRELEALLDSAQVMISKAWLKGVSLEEQRVWLERWATLRGVGA